ncbi:uncharacterized protein LOC141679450 [Apium graveolens]|uniref:uncharacterized protein LOC141679450 n=1 Tax=Apium graveolens TaxID=4045 RepID=UPI003D7A7EFD
MVNNSNNFFIRSILEKNKLTGTNFLDWQRNLRIVLKQERKLHVIDVPCPGPLPEGATCVQQAAYQKHIDDDTDVTCLMLGDRDPVGSHVLKMIGYMEYLATLGSAIAPEAQIYMILQSLNINYAQFVMNYNINEIDKTPTKLLAMLKTAETNIQKASPAPIMMVNKGSAKWKVNKKMESKSAVAPKTTPKQALKPGGGFAKGDTCHYCKKPEVSLSTSTSWELRGCRTLKKGEVDLHVGNEAKVAALL